MFQTTNHLIYGGFLSHGRTPIVGWFIEENTILRWMISGYPHFSKAPHSLYVNDQKNVACHSLSHGLYPIHKSG